MWSYPRSRLVQKWTIHIGSGITIGIGTAVLLVEAKNQILEFNVQDVGPSPLQPVVNITQALQFLLDPSYGPIVDG